jgi:hypothetical protein
VIGKDNELVRENVGLDGEDVGLVWEDVGMVGEDVGLVGPVLALVGEGQVGWGKCLVGRGRLSSLVETMSFWIWGYIRGFRRPCLRVGRMWCLSGWMSGWLGSLSGWIGRILCWLGSAVGEDFWFGREDVDLVWEDKLWFGEDTGLGIWE